MPAGNATPKRAGDDEELTETATKNNAENEARGSGQGSDLIVGDADISNTGIGADNIANNIATSKDKTKRRLD